MTSLVLAVLWIAFVILILIPMSTIVARAILSLGRRRRSRETGTNFEYFLILLPTLAPIVWFLSETLHQAESFLVGPAGTIDFCYDLVIASSILLITFATLAVRYILTEHQRPGHLIPLATQRLQALCTNNPALVEMAPRIVAIQGGEHDCATRGLFVPRIEIDAVFAASLRDDGLVAVLLHEVEHLRKRDPLKNLLGRVCLTMNPLGRWLVPDWQRWRAGRELRCDAAALSAYADPLSLAEALLLAARPLRPTMVAAPLTGESQGMLTLRVERLLEPVVGPPESSYGTAIPMMVFLLELILPHTLSSAPIQQIHNIAFHPLLTALVG